MRDPVGRFGVDKVRAAAWEFAQGLEGKVNVWVAQDQVAKILSLPVTWRDGRARFEYDSVRRLEGQIYRSLNQLAEQEDPLLMRVGKDEPGPDGKRYRMAMYWSPRAYQLADEAHATRLAEWDGRSRRWQAVVARLAELGFASQDSHRPVFPLETWESLAGRIQPAELLYTYERGQGH